MVSDLACRSRRQRSQRRKDGKQKAEEEQQSEINSGSPPEKQAQPRRGRPLDITSRVNPGQEPVTTTGNPGQESAAANSSSSAHESSEKTIVNASSNTVAKRFSESPVVQEASPVQKPAQDQKQLPTANTSHHSASVGDDHVNHHLIAALDHGEGDGDGQEEEEAEREPPSGSGSGDVGTVNRGGPESRSAAFVSDFEAAAVVLRGSDEFPSSKQYVLVEHL